MNSAAALRAPGQQATWSSGDEPRPSPELVTIAAKPEPGSSSPAVPLACHIGRASPVPNGQPRSLSPFH
jgi:hypothetical protein